MMLKSERLPGEIEETLGAGEKRVKLVFASSHSIPKVGEFSLFNEFFEEGEEDTLPERSEPHYDDYEYEDEPCENAPSEEKLVSEYEDELDCMIENIEIPADIHEEINKIWEKSWENMDARLYRMLEQILDEKNPQQDEDADKYVLRCSGVMSERDGNIVIRYNEEESGGMGATQSEIVIPDGRSDMVSIVRTGGVVSTLVCEKGRRHISAYRTPVMPFEVCVFAKECEHTVNFETGGSIFLNYYVELRGTEMQHTKMRITVKVV